MQSAKCSTGGGVGGMCWRGCPDSRELGSLVQGTFHHDVNLRQKVTCQKLVINIHEHLGNQGLLYSEW